ncbi:MAG: DAK2 domain-containing protein, partial [Spirochaetota bacterium]
HLLTAAGVVDAGGLGLYIILEGALQYLKTKKDVSQKEPLRVMTADSAAGVLPRITSSNDTAFGFCTEFILRGKRLNPDRIRSSFENRGDSLLIAGNGVTVRVHIHTSNPNAVLSLARSFGSVDQVSIRDMDKQHKAYRQNRGGKNSDTACAVIAVASGPGLIEVFKSLGSAYVVNGEMGLKACVEVLSEAVEAAAVDKIIILPNNGNFIPASEQVASGTRKQIAVIPSKTIPQGISSMVAFNSEENFETNVRLMKKAVNEVTSIEICNADRLAGLNTPDIRGHQIIGFLEGKPAAAGDSHRQTLEKILERLQLENRKLMTVYYGAALSQTEAEELCAYLQPKYGLCEIEIVSSGHLTCDYIISIE